jgi:hypothetical protein
MQIDLRFFVFRVVCGMNIIDLQVFFTVRKLLTSTILLAAIFFSGKIFALQEGIFSYSVAVNEAVISGCVTTCPTNLIIPEEIAGYSVTSIGGGAFSNNALTSVTIPDSVEIIESGALWAKVAISLWALHRSGLLIPEMGPDQRLCKTSGTKEQI